MGTFQVADTRPQQVKTAANAKAQAKVEKALAKADVAELVTRLDTVNLAIDKMAGTASPPTPGAWQAYKDAWAAASTNGQQISALNTAMREVMPDLIDTLRAVKLLLKDVKALLKDDN